MDTRLADIELAMRPPAAIRGANVPTTWHTARLLLPVPILADLVLVASQQPHVHLLTVVRLQASQRAVPRARLPVLRCGCGPLPSVRLLHAPSVRLRPAPRWQVLAARSRSGCSGRPARRLLTLRRPFGVLTLRRPWAQLASSLRRAVLRWRLAGLPREAAAQRAILTQLHPSASASGAKLICDCIVRLLAARIAQAVNGDRRPDAAAGAACRGGQRPPAARARLAGGPRRQNTAVRARRQATLAAMLAGGPPAQAAAVGAEGHAARWAVLTGRSHGRVAALLALGEAAAIAPAVAHSECVVATVRAPPVSKAGVPVVATQALVIGGLPAPGKLVRARAAR